MENFSLKNDQTTDREELSIADLLKTIYSNWLFIAILALTGFVGSLGFCATIPPQYQASALIQIGRVVAFSQNSISGSSSLGGPGFDIETTGQLVERLNSSGFYNRWRNTGEAGISISATAIKNTRLLRISARAHSEKLVVTSLTKAVKLIEEDHKIMSDQAEETLFIALRNARDQLGAVTESIEYLNKAIIKSGSVGSDLIGSLIVTQTQQQLLSQRIALGGQVSSLQAAIIEQKGSRTMAIESIQASKEPVYPKTQLIALIGIIGGGFIGVLLVLLRHTYKK